MLFLFLTVVHSAKYAIDPTWAPQYPSNLTLNGVTGVAVVEEGLSGSKEIHVAQHGTPAIFVFAESGRLLRTWLGSDHPTEVSTVHGISAQKTTVQGKVVTHLWVADYGPGPAGHAVRVFDISGKLLHTLGTPGTAGQGTSPLQFGNVADFAFTSNGTIFISDGDGGVNNRVVKLSANLKVEKVFESNFQHPHSITVDDWHRVWVADRENNVTRVFTLDFKEITSLNCFITPNGGRPWGVRTLHNTLFVVDGTEGRVLTLDISAQIPTCKISEVVPIDRSKLGNPHLLDIDSKTGSIYVANVNSEGQPTSCVRLIRT